LNLQDGADLILKYCKLNFIEFMIIEGDISSNYITMKILRNVGSIKPFYFT